MSLTLVMLSLRAQRPAAEYVIWSRIDQKAVLKAILAAGLKPLVVDVVPTAPSDRPVRKRQKKASGKAKDLPARPAIVADGGDQAVSESAVRAPSPSHTLTSCNTETAANDADVQLGSAPSTQTQSPCIDQLSTNVSEIDRLLALHRDKVSASDD